MTTGRLIELTIVANERNDADMIELCKEVSRLREIVDELPKTADGVPVYHGMGIWTQFYLDIIEIPVKIEARGPNCDGRGTEPYPISRCYSTSAAAEAARKDGGK